MSGTFRKGHRLWSASNRLNKDCGQGGIEEVDFMDVTVLCSLLLGPGINPGHVWTPGKAVCHYFKVTFQAIWMYFQLCCVWGNMRYWKKVVLDWISILSQNVFLWKLNMFYLSEERLTNGRTNNSGDRSKISVVFQFAFCTVDYTTFSKAAYCALF